MAPPAPPAAPAPPPGMSGSSTRPTTVPPSWTGATNPNNQENDATPIGKTTPQHFYYGSPLNGGPTGGTAAPPNSSTSGDLPGTPYFPASSPAMAGAGTQLRPFDWRDWSTDGKKTSKELKTFNGDLASFDTWRMRVRYDLVGKSCNYSHTLDLSLNSLHVGTRC